MVRVFRFPPRAQGRRRAADAAIGRGSCHGRGARVGNPAHRQRQVRLLSDPGSLPIRQNGCPNGGHIASRRLDGRPGDWLGATGDRLLRDRQRASVHARTQGCLGPRAVGGRRYPARVTGAAPQPCPEAGHWTTTDRLLGIGRGPLPLPMGPRFPARLPLCGEVHTREGRRG